MPKTIFVAALLTMMLQAAHANAAEDKKNQLATTNKDGSITLAPSVVDKIAKYGNLLAMELRDKGWSVKANTYLDKLKKISESLPTVPRWLQDYVAECSLSQSKNHPDSGLEAAAEMSRHASGKEGDAGSYIARLKSGADGWKKPVERFKTSKILKGYFKPPTIFTRKKR